MMNERNKKAAPNGANIGNGKAEKYTLSSINSACNYTQSFENKQGLIASLLQKGKENAITAEQLRTILGLSTTRQICRMIAAERQNGNNILSSKTGKGGYFLPADGEQGREEMERYVRTVWASAFNTLAAAKPAIAELNKNENQLDLFSPAFSQQEEEA